MACPADVHTLLIMGKRPLGVLAADVRLLLQLLLHALLCEPQSWSWLYSLISACTSWLSASCLGAEALAWSACRARMEERRSPRPGVVVVGVPVRLGLRLVRSDG